nr:reverse transcriptase domain-containing protein [Tanacetum cinerariifolium]
MEVFMDDFLVFGNSFGTCLSHLEKMLQRCEDANLCLNWEKSHFMVKEGIVLDHKISKNGIEVDKAKVDVITKLPHPTTVKEGIVLGHKISKNGIEVDKAKVDVIAKLPHPTTIKGGVFKAMKPLTFSRPATMDPLGDIMARTTPPKRERFRNMMKCLKIPFKFARFSKFGASISWGRFRLELPVPSLLITVRTHRRATVYHRQTSGQTAGDHRKVKLNELNELHDQAYENSLIYKEKTKRLHDSKIKDRVFNVGDRVLLFNSRLNIFLGKLKTRWSGPFTITHVFPYGTVELSQTDGPNFKVNGHRQKHYYREDIPKMVVPDLPTFPRTNECGDWVKLSDPKQALYGRHPMLILVIIMNTCVVVWRLVLLFLVFCGFFRLLIDELDLHCDFLLPSEYDSFSKDFSEVDALPSTNNKDKDEKKLAISHASLMLEDFDPPLYELPLFKEVPRLSILESSRRTKNDSVKCKVKAKQGLFGNPKSSYVQFVSFSPPGHLAARLGCAEMKFVTWDGLAFKLITLGWNVKHKNLANR